MRNFKIIFNFELKNILNSKSFKVATAIILLVILALTFAPRFMGADSEEIEAIIPQGEEELIEEVDWPKEDYGIYLDKSLSVKDFSFMDKFTVYDSLEELKAKVEDESIRFGLYLESLEAMKVFTNDLSTEDISFLVENEMNMLRKEAFAKENKIGMEKLEEYEGISMTKEYEKFGKDGLSGYIMAFAGLMIIYFLIIFYGSNVATSVAREKNDRTMELLITNTSPDSLIWGKVLANSLVSIGNIILMILVAYLGFSINKAYYPSGLISLLVDNINISQVAVYLSYGILGTILYYFLFASVGALVNKVEEVSGAVGPITFLIVIAFLITNTGMNMPASNMMRIASLFPFSSPMAMFVRYALTSVAGGEVLLGLGILALTTLLMARLAIKIYRMGTLNYGNKMSFIKAIKKVLFKK